MNVLVKAIAGSHLFGTNTPASDTDFKGVYLPSKKDLLLGTATPSISVKTNDTGTKNTKDDVDVEFYSLQKFMQMLHEGQTVALELLWTPEEQIISTSPFWEELRSHRTELLHKKVTAFVHYCKTQANKYGVKGSRMAAAKKTLEALELFRNENKALKYSWDELKRLLANVEHIEFGEQETKAGSIPYFEVCSRMFQDNCKVEYAINSLNKLYNDYGARARAAEDSNGIDWKALSHAYRVCCQAIEILQDGKLSLPLKEEDRAFVLKVKMGEMSFKEFQPILEAKLDVVLEWTEKSTLPQDFDYKKWCEDFVMKVYTEVINS